MLFVGVLGYTVSVMDAYMWVGWLLSNGTLVSCVLLPELSFVNGTEHLYSMHRYHVQFLHVFMHVFAPVIAVGYGRGMGGVIRE